VTVIRMGLLLVTLVSGVGCARSLAPTRNPSSLSLASRVVYRHYDAPHRGDDGAWSGGGLPLALALDAEGNAWVLGESHSKLQFVSVILGIKPDVIH
jgi:hypothetical protein